MKIDSMQGLLVEELKDLYDAEKQLVRALPKFAKAAADEELGQAFRHHLDQTKGQVERLERVFGILGTKPKARPCKGMKGLVEESVEFMNEDATEALSDEAIIGAAQKVEHYEIAGYGSARTLAQAIGQKDAVQLLQETLNEEDEADKKLTQIAKRLVKHIGGDGDAQPQARPRKRATTAARSGGGDLSKITTDHEEIRRWAEERGAHPACVKGTRAKDGSCLLRLDFPGYTGEESLEPITWDQFFQIFDQRGLALVYEEKTSKGEKSNFNKLVSREELEEKAA
jgi:ferritin-like metal-binding protein YciE